MQLIIGHVLDNMDSETGELVLGALRLSVPCSEQLFKFLEQNSQKVLDRDLTTVQELSRLQTKVSASPPTADRAKSFGKDIELILNSSGYAGTAAAALGILKQVQISRHLGFCSLVTLNRVARCLAAYGFPTRLSLDRPPKFGTQSPANQKLALISRVGEFETVTVNDVFIRLVLEPEISVVPNGPIFGTVTVPGSKSLSNRVLLMAALGQGSCDIEGLLDSDDIQVMLVSLSQLGVQFTWSPDGETLTVIGCGGKFKKPSSRLYLNNSGTSARFLTSAVCLVEPEDEPWHFTILDGNPRMRERPIAPLVAALELNGCDIRYLTNMGCLPIAVAAKRFKGGKIEMEGKVSSQYVSSLLISGPYAAAPLTLQLAEEAPVSLPYILMTVQLMQDFGIPAKFIPPNKFEVPTGIYTNPKRFAVEPDASSSTYILAMAAITGGEVTVRHLGSKSLQGDSKFYEALEAMGCQAQQTESQTTVYRRSDQRLRGIEISMETLTDAFMTIAVLAAVAEGRTEIRGIANQRVKECNRIAVMVTELTKLGVSCGELEDGLWILGVNDLGDLKTPVRIQCHDDHRIALSFAVLGSLVPGIVITDKECTSKTYPSFWDDCRALQVALCPGSLVSSVAGIDMEPVSSNQSFDPVFLIGMRGCGKTTFGKLGAAAVGASFLCMDYLLEAQFGKKLPTFVAENGWAAFRAAEEALLRRIVSAAPRNTIISCGGGVVDTRACVEMLRNSACIIHIERPWPDVKGHLTQDASRPSLLEDLEVTWARRRPLYMECSKHEFKTRSGALEKTTTDFIEFLKTVLEKPKI